jgi:methionine-rich copper-binding protein CopC
MSRLHLRQILEDRFMGAAARILAVAATLTALLAMPATALGHVALVSSSPAAGENLDIAPTEVTLTFDDELDPATSSFTVTNADSHEVVGTGEVDLTVADRNVLTGDVTITDPGVYTVGYAVTGIDGHQIGGAFSFGYNADEAIPAPTDEEHPDTAMPRPELPLTAGAGGLLLALGVLLGARRLAAR